MTINVTFDTSKFRLDDQKKKINKLGNTAVSVAAVQSFREIFSVWPVDTYWSRANHRFSTTGGVRLDPPVRPEASIAPLAFAQNNVEVTNARAIANSTTPVSEAIIGNAVPYAPDVGFRKGAGARIYRQAAENAARVLPALVRAFTRNTS